MASLNDMNCQIVVGEVRQKGFVKKFWQSYRSSAAKGSDVGKCLDALPGLGIGINCVLEKPDVEKKTETLAAYKNLLKAFGKAKSKCHKSRQKHTIKLIEEYEKVTKKQEKAASEYFSKLEKEKEKSVKEQEKVEKAKQESESQKEDLEKLGLVLNQMMDVIITANKDLSANEDWFTKASNVYTDAINRSGFKAEDAKVVLKNFEAGASKFNLDKWHQQTTVKIPKALKEAKKLLPGKPESSLKTLHKNLSESMKSVVKELAFSSQKANQLKEMQKLIVQRVTSDRNQAQQAN